MKSAITTLPEETWKTRKGTHFRPKQEGPGQVVLHPGGFLGKDRTILLAMNVREHSGIRWWCFEGRDRGVGSGHRSGVGEGL